MNTHKKILIVSKILVCLLFVTTLLLAAGESARGDSAVPENKVPRRVESKAVQLTQELEKQGFEVIRGYFKLWTIADCEYTSNKVGLCYGNNPAAPYVITTLPRWPEEFVDPVYSNLFGPSKEDYHDYHDVYRFDPREAIVILGLLPPPGAYFSEQTWIFSRKGVPDTNSETYHDIEEDDLLNPFLPIFFRTMPNDPDRAQVFASLSNPVNNVVIKRQSGAIFNQVRYIIVTPDQFMDTAVRNAFAGISVKDEDIFTERIPSDMQVGLGQSADDFTTWFRYAHPRDGGRLGTPSDNWRKEPPMVVLRVRDTQPDRQPQTYPPVVLEDRDAVNEVVRFESDLESLLFEVSRRWGQPCANTNCSDRAETFKDLQASPTNTVGPLCIPIKENCLGDNWDASYGLYGPLPLDNGEIYAVAGTLGTETGNATYVAVGVNEVPKLKGVADLSEDDLRGTVKAYVRKVNNTHKFFLYYFTRDCSGLEDLTDGNCFPIQDLIPLGHQFAISVRNYIKPGTQRGPDSSKLLPASILMFTQP